MLTLSVLFLFVPSARICPMFGVRVATLWMAFDTVMCHLPLRFDICLKMVVCGRPPMLFSAPIGAIELNKFDVRFTYSLETSSSIPIAMLLAVSVSLASPSKGMDLSCQSMGYLCSFCVIQRLTPYFHDYLALP